MQKCSACPNPARAIGQRYCLDCHAKSQKVYREAHPTLTAARAKVLHVEHGQKDRRRERGTKC